MRYPVPGNCTIPCYMRQGKLDSPWNHKSPFCSPGSAPAKGNGCGVYGGRGKCNPDDPECPPCNDEPYGTKCGAGISRGKSAVEHAADGLFDQAPYTHWFRGQPTSVYFYPWADHRGVYAYRLCKVSWA